MNFQCLSCGGKRFQSKTAKIDTELRGQYLSLDVEGLVCEDCGQVLMDTQMMSRFQVLASDEFRRKNGLLPSSIIRQYRENLGLTQYEFAEFLGVGVASLKRWEGPGIQDKSHDELIRIKCDPYHARKNVEMLEAILRYSHDITKVNAYINEGEALVSSVDYSPVRELRLKA